MKKLVWSVGILAALFLVYFVITGFLKNGSAYVEDFTVSDDGREITLHMGVASSMGYLRNVSVHQQEGGKLYLDCLSAFGGVNGSVGARDTFTAVLEEDTAIIALYRARDCYEEVLIKGADGVWQRAAQ